MGTKQKAEGLYTICINEVVKKSKGNYRKRIRNKDIRKNLGYVD